MADRPTRVRVVRSTSVRRAPVEMLREIDEQTALGEALVRTLVRAQLRLALTVLVVLGATIGALPVLFALAPPVRHAHLLGLPLPWVLLGGAVYPALLALGWFYVRSAERNEAAFVDVLQGP